MGTLKLILYFLLLLIMSIICIDLFAESSMNWISITPSASFSKRWGHTSVIFDDGEGEKIWIIGGRISNWTLKNDVWCSIDGVNWIQKTSNAEFSPRSYHSSIVFKNKMWVIGGWDGNRKNDVWCSDNGITWTLITASAGFSPRNGQSNIIFDDGDGEKLWIIAGTEDGNDKNDVWYSTDGLSWTLKTPSASFIPRREHSSVVYNNKMWVISGNEDMTGYKNDVWSSSDGFSWTQETYSADFSLRTIHNSAVFNNKIWVIGGTEDYYNPDKYKNDVWSSVDGIKWIEHIDSDSFHPRGEHTSIVFKNQIWIIAGFDHLNYYNDVWRSDFYSNVDFVKDFYK